MRTRFLCAAAAAVVAFFAVAWTIDDPGLTVDEPINLGHGKTMTGVLFSDPGAVYRPDGVQKIWKSGHEHPPLTRFLIGCGQRLFDPAPNQKLALHPHGGRLASAAAFAGIVFLCVWFTAAMGGLFAGIAAGVAAAAMPRLFGHAHLASPEVIHAAFFLWAIAALGWAAEVRVRTGRAIPFAAAAVILGFALLTKLTAVLIPVAAGIALLPVRWGRLTPLLVFWGMVGVSVFIYGWPWLWPQEMAGYPPGPNGTVARLREFVATGSDRATLYTWYLDRQYAGPELPWHYAWVFLAGTLPPATFFAGLMGLGASMVQMGVCLRRRVAAAAIVVGMGFFTLPVHRYDSERLFLFVFPLWACFAGLGAAWLATRFRNRAAENAVRAVVLAGLCLPISSIVRLHPCELSYFSGVVGGLPGAERIGLEATCWGDSLTTTLLDQLAEHATAGDGIALLPTLYAGHAAYLTSPGLSRKELQVVPGDWLREPGGLKPGEHGTPAKWVVLFNRRGYLIDPLPSRVLKEGKVAAELSRSGVWLGRVMELPAGWMVATPK